MRARLLFVLLGVVTCLLFSQAHAGSGNENAAVQSARIWLSLIDDGRYSHSWSEASTYFQGAVSQEKWVASLEGVRKPLGKVLYRRVVKKKETRELPGAPDGKYVVIIFTSSFEKKKKATETVTFMFDKNGTWKAAGYFIR